MIPSIHKLASVLSLTSFEHQHPSLIGLLILLMFMMSAQSFRFLTAAQKFRLYETSIIRARPTQMTYLESAVSRPSNTRTMTRRILFS
ncbi:Heterokaryon incompatibility protein 6, OR allele [Fusarium oxysporum f. sp. albedinis]|nr:Heterokaryon incompatibility protein 6, OR allele [Fusarium oxysporum f. sp. albedinis]